MKKSRWFWGSFALIGAGVLLGSQVGWFSYSFSPASLVLTLLLAATLITSLVSLWLTGIVFSLAGLSIVYAVPLHLTQLSNWMILLIALLVDIGLSLLLHPFLKRRHKSRVTIINGQGNKQEVHIEKNIHQRHRDMHNDDDESKLFFADKISSSTRYLHNKNLEEVTFDVSMGELKAFFDDVEPAGPELTINLNVMMGEAQLFIPQEWEISNELDYSVSSIDLPAKPDLKTTMVHLRGNVNFAQVSIVYI